MSQRTYRPFLCPTCGAEVWVPATVSEFGGRVTVDLALARCTDGCKVLAGQIPLTFVLEWTDAAPSGELVRVCREFYQDG